MIDSVPGPDIIHPETADRRDSDTLRGGALSQGARTSRHAVCGRLRTAAPSQSQYQQTTLTPAAASFRPSAISRSSTWRSRKVLLLRPDTLAAARRPAVGAGRPAAAARSRLVRPELQRRDDCLAVRRHAEHLIVAHRHAALAGRDAGPAGEQRRARRSPFAPATADVTTSPFVRLFLGFAVR